MRLPSALGGNEQRKVQVKVTNKMPSRMRGLHAKGVVRSLDALVRTLARTRSKLLRDHDVQIREAGSATQVRATRRALVVA